MAAAPNYRLGYSQKRFKPPLKKAAVQRTSSQFHYTSSPTTQYNNASSTPIQSQLSRESRELNVKLDDSLCHESSTTPDSSLEQLEESEEELSEERYTQTHTVLSYCDEVRSGGVDEAPERTSDTGGGCHVTSHLFDLNEPMNSSDEEENEASNTHSRFVRKQQQSKTYKYDFDAILHRKVANRKRRAQKHSQPNRKQRVHIAPQPTVVRYGQARGGGATGCALDREEGAVDHRRDLSVFDYQPTPQEGGALDGGGCGQRINESTVSKFDVSVCGRSKEEQLAIDREVLKVIAQTCEEIRALRLKHAARKSNAINHLFSRPQSRLRERVKKPPLDITITAYKRPSVFNESMVVYSLEE